MRKVRRRLRRKRPIEHNGDPFVSRKALSPTEQTKTKQGPFYRAGPVFNLGTVQTVEADEEEEAHNSSTTNPVAAVTEEVPTTASALTTAHLDEDEVAIGPAPTTSGAGTTSHSVAFARTALTLRGRTDANFDGGSFQTENVRGRLAEGCESCTADCVHVTGTLVATYHVTTTVTLPSVDDFPDLTPCQRQRVQAAIDNVLAPHEQEHVRAFQQYNGTTRRRFDLTLCRSEFDGRIREMFETEAAGRRQATQAASDALDPFHFTVDLNCEDRPAKRSEAGGISSDAEESEEEQPA